MSGGGSTRSSFLKLTVKISKFNPFHGHDIYRKRLCIVYMIQLYPNSLEESLGYRPSLSCLSVSSVYAIWLKNYKYKTSI